MGAGNSVLGGLVAGISAAVMALAAVGAGYTYSLWQEFPTASDRIGAAVLETLEPLVPSLFAFCVCLFVLSAVAAVYSVRQFRTF